MLYLLTVDGMGQHNGQVFSTKDRDNDTWNKNCAEAYKGGWWYTSCYGGNINGLYVGNKSSKDSMNWFVWKRFQSMKTASMMIRRKCTN
jgi:ficolin